MEQNKQLTLGSLFDGSGGFPLGGLLAGIKPIWASEIEPFAVRVTTKRMPGMKHYGDISLIDGSKIEPVDVITFGSPCTDMSVAGKRAGLDGSRSNLFYQAVRIIKEMRKATGGEYPKWACWENVPGAFSSSGGEDFRCVLESLCGIVDESVSVPKPEKWANAGEIVGDGYSIAWRVLDAQYWGVPQRRKRIYLVADLTGGCAGKVLFESEGLSGYSAEGFRAWQRTSCRAEDGAGAAGAFCLNTQGHSGFDLTFERTNALVAQAHGNDPCVAYSAGFCTEHSADSRSIGYEEEKSPTLRAGAVPAAVALDNHPADSRVKMCEDGICPTLTNRCGTGGKNVPLVMEDERKPPIKAYCICAVGSNSMKSANPHSGIYEAATSRTLDLNGGDPSPNQGGLCICEPVACVDQREEVRDLSSKAGAIAAEPGIHQQTYVIQGSVIGRKDKNGPNGSGVNENVCFTLNTVDCHAVAAPSEDDKTYAMTTGSFTQVQEEVSPTLMARNYKDPAVVNDPVKEPEYIVRRLTPTECALLQGFPRDWCQNLGTENPTEEEIRFWTEVWETHRRLISHTAKPKTEKQIRKWLADPYSDAAEYKLWGNGVALPCVYFVLSGIVWADGLSNT